MQSVTCYLSDDEEEDSSQDNNSTSSSDNEVEIIENFVPQTSLLQEEVQKHFMLDVHGCMQKQVKSTVITFN